MMHLKPPSTLRPRWTLFLLSLVAIIGFIDRQVVTILMEPIKHDLDFSDTMLGAISGTAFAIFYVTAAFPLARWGDHGDRRLIITLCVAVWSVATALCGAALNFAQLAAARIGVAIGESGANPISQSLLLDLFPASRRAWVLAILNAANSIGLGAGFALGGWLATLYSWRTVFVIVGLPGLVLALLLALTASEPRRNQPAGAPPPLSDVAATLLRLPGMGWMVAVAATTSLCGFGLLTWGPSFMVRVHGMPIQAVGAEMGAATVGGLVIGSLVAGKLADWAGRSDIRWYAWISAIGLLLSFPATLAFVFWPGSTGALVCFFLLELCMTSFMPSLFALALSIAPSNMRATTAATLSMAINLVGAGVAPLAVGAISDFITPRFGDQSLRYSLLVLSSGLVLGATAAFMAGRRLGAGRLSADGTGLLQPGARLAE